MIIQYVVLKREGGREEGQKEKQITITAVVSHHQFVSFLLFVKALTLKHSPNPN